MTEYRRPQAAGATWFFTVNLAERLGNRLLLDNIDALRQMFRRIKDAHPFKIDAIVVLPEHLHASGRCRRATSTTKRDGA